MRARGLRCQDALQPIVMIVLVAAFSPGQTWQFRDPEVGRLGVRPRPTPNTSGGYVAPAARRACPMHPGGPHSCASSAWTCCLVSCSLGCGRRGGQVGVPYLEAWLRCRSTSGTSRYTMQVFIRTRRALTSGIVAHIRGQRLLLDACAFDSRPVTSHQSPGGRCASRQASQSH